MSPKIDVFILSEDPRQGEDLAARLAAGGCVAHVVANFEGRTAFFQPAVIFQIEPGFRETKAPPAVESPETATILISPDMDATTQRLAMQTGYDAALSSDADEGSILGLIHFARQKFERDRELTNALEKLHTTNENMAYASRRFEELFNGLPVACFTVSSDGVIHDWNREAEEAFGISSADAFMQPLEALLGEPSHGIWSEMTLNEICAYGDLQRIQWTFTGADGSEKTFMGTVYPSVGRSGEISGMISANIDITDRVAAQKQIHDQMGQLASMNHKLAQLSVTDGLTGLFNHRHFQERLTEALRGAAHAPVSLILLDVDHFKKYNDSFGHVAGDAVLKRVAAIFAELFLDPDTPARYGGEEFAAILPAHTTEQALARAEQLRAAIEGSDWIERAVTASLGVSTTDNPALSGKELIRQADEALYQSKEAGRNRVTPFGEASSEQAA